MTLLFCREEREVLFKLNAYSGSYILLQVEFMHFIQMISHSTEEKDSLKLFLKRKKSKKKHLQKACQLRQLCKLDSASKSGYFWEQKLQTLLSSNW